MEFNHFDDWSEVARLGNYVVKSFVDEELKYFCVKAVSGECSVVVRVGHPWYRLLEALGGEHDTDAYRTNMEAFVSLVFIQMGLLPDTQFFEEYSRSVTELVMRADIVLSEEDASLDALDADMAEVGDFLEKSAP